MSLEALDGALDRNAPKTPLRIRGIAGWSPASVGIHLVVAMLAAISLTPLFWLICATFKTSEDFFTYAFLPWRHPERWSVGNYSFLVREHPFAVWMFNSLFLSSTHTAIVVALSSLGGFALAKYRFAGKKPLMGVMLATMLLPRSEEHTSELQSPCNLVCRLLLEKKK